MKVNCLTYVASYLVLKLITSKCWSFLQALAIFLLKFKLNSNTKTCFSALDALYVKGLKFKGTSRLSGLSKYVVHSFKKNHMTVT